MMEGATCVKHSAVNQLFFAAEKDVGENQRRRILSALRTTALVLLAAVLLGAVSLTCCSSQPRAWLLGPRNFDLDFAQRASASSAHNPAVAKAYGAIAAQIIAAADSRAEELFERLCTLSYSIGARIVGSPALDLAIEWAKKEMEKDGLEEVRTMRVEGIVNWTRGDESLEMLEPRYMKLSMLGLGGSVGGHVAGEVLLVADYAELAARANEAEGKIVLFNNHFVSYEKSVTYRVSGATAAARVGAVAVVVRSVSSFSMGNPHTGVMSYEGGDADNVTRIPAAAVATEHADMLSWLIARGHRVALRLQMEARTWDPAPSFNVLGQVTGRELPGEVVTVGGHLDSWDVGLGAMDDGAGLLVCWEAVRLLKHLNLRPRRTVRVVAFVDEEQGTDDVSGGNTYALAKGHEKHVMAIESDSGTFSPLGFYAWGEAAAQDVVRELAGTLLASLNATLIANATDGGSDVTPLHEYYGTFVMELKSNASRYFWYHHSAADTPDKMNATEMARCAATIAVMAYTIADLEKPLPASVPTRPIESERVDI